MRLAFPNLQYQEGRTISQLFTVDFLSFLRDDGIPVKSVDLNNMEAEVDSTVDLDSHFNKYIDRLFRDTLGCYHYTTKMLSRGKVDIAKKAKKLDDFTRSIFEPTENVKLSDMREKLFAGHITTLNEIKENIKDYRCVQADTETGTVCSVCGLVNGKKSDITERISLVSDKCWKPLGQYEQLKGCVRCASVLGLISNLQSLWRINITGKGRQTRYVVIPKFKINTTEPAVIEEIERYLNLLGIFRVRATGKTSTDYIFNSFRAQPIIAKIVAGGNLDLMIYTQSATGQGGFVTENAISSEKVRKIAEFAVDINRHFPRNLVYADAGAKLGSFPRALSDATYLYIMRGKDKAWCEFFTQTKENFDIVMKVLGDGKMKVEYFKTPDAIRDMDEYEWDNPLVRISTFFVAERAQQFRTEGKKPDQAINSPMALFNSIPKGEKTKKIREFLADVTNNGKSYLLSSIGEPEEFLSTFSKALNACNPQQLKEMVRYMRMFANTFIYRSDKERYHKETIEELGYTFRIRQRSKGNKEVVE